MVKYDWLLRTSKEVLVLSFGIAALGDFSTMDSSRSGVTEQNLSL